MTECKYEGCEEKALEGSECCIFHKPDKNEEEAREFYKKIRQEAREPEGEIFEDEEGEEHKRWVFEEEVNWTGFYFPSIPDEQETEAKCFSFLRAKFRKSVKFNHAHFVDIVTFGRARFENKVKFKNTHFNGPATFFTDIDFEDEVSFRNAEFNSIGVDFNRTHFEGTTVFSNAEFASPPYFQDTTFKDDTWGEYAYRTVRQQWEEKGDRDRADDYFQREMIMKRGQMNWISLERPFSYLMSWTTGYGTSWPKVLRTWAFIIGLFGTVYWLFPTSLNGNGNIAESFYFSIITFTTLGYGDIHPVGNLWQLIAGFESVLGGILMAAFVLVFGRKYMR